jgi:fermentation-respiration switch protein FrsA (DUF1100 family)
VSYVRDDAAVDPRNALRLFGALRRKNSHVVLREYESGGHTYLPRGDDLKVPANFFYDENDARSPKLMRTPIM